VTNEEFRRAEVLFESAAALPEQDRDAFLRGQEGEGEAIIRMVRDLLAADAASGNFLEAAIGRAAGETLGQSTDGREFGDWRVVRLLGEGGMGAVYLAERRKEDFEQTAAVKVLRLGLVTPELVERFRSERSILARLQHPNIAVLLDGGATESGMPWFAMEYVQGRALHRYCEQERIGVRERVRLMINICQAVQYAHSNLVIHRDLKPSNILVSDDGVVKLLDFGIARLLERDGATEPEEVQVRMLTPEYASPEQRDGRPVSTASDIYSLGRILRRMTAGLPDGNGRDLEAIAEKALASEADGRYPSAEAMAGDLKRYLDGYPVSARPETYGYVTRKFIQRNRVASGITALALAALLTVTAVALRQRERANRERDTAEAALRFLTEVFAAPDPNETLGRSPSAEQLLNAGAQRIGEELRDQPAVRARLKEVMASAYRGLAEFKKAETLLREALATKEQLYGRGSLEVSDTIAALAGVLYEDGRAAEALPLDEEALGIRRRLAPDSEKVADSLYELAIELDDAGDLEKAEAMARESVDLYRKRNGERSANAADSLMILADILRHGGKMEDSLPYYRLALSIRQQVKGAEHPDTALTLNHLGRGLIQLNRPVEAIPHVETALRIHRSVYGESHPVTIATRSNLAGALHAVGELDRSAALYRESLRHLQTRFGDRHPYVAAAHGSIAAILMAKGDLQGAIPESEASVALFRKLLPAQHPDLARSLTQRGTLLRRLGRLEAAEGQLREAERMQTALLKENHPDLALTRASLGRCLLERGRTAEAEQKLLAAWGPLQASRGGKHPLAREAAGQLAELYRKTKRPAEAEKWDGLAH
jgi:serine/threonine-protein kinase